MPFQSLARNLPLASTPNKRLKGKYTSLRGDTFVNAIPALLQHSRRLPRILGIAQPQADQVTSSPELSVVRPLLEFVKHLLLLCRVPKAGAGVENAQVVDILDVALTKVQRHGVLFGRVVQRVQGLGLGFGDGRNIGGPRQAPIPRESAPGVLDDEAFGVGVRCCLEVQQWCRGEWLVGLAEAAWLLVVVVRSGQNSGGNSTYVSASHGSESV